MKQSDFEAYIEELFGKEKLTNRGADFGFSAQCPADIKRVGYCTNLTPDTAAQAVQSGVDMILTHHEPWDEIMGWHAECTAALQRNGIGHFFIHPALDDAEFGTGASFLRKIGVEVAESSNPCGVFHWGRIGLLDRAASLEKLVSIIEERIGEKVKAWKNHERLIRRIAVVPGAAHNPAEIKDVVENGKCDVYMTGEKLIYTVLYARYAGINLIVASHTFTEFFGVESLAFKIRKHFPKIELVHIEEEHIE